MINCASVEFISNLYATYFTLGGILQKKVFYWCTGPIRMNTTSCTGISTSTTLYTVITGILFLLYYWYTIITNVLLFLLLYRYIINTINRYTGISWTRKYRYTVKGLQYDWTLDFLIISYNFWHCPSMWLLSMDVANHSLSSNRCGVKRSACLRIVSACMKRNLN